MPIAFICVVSPGAVQVAYGSSILNTSVASSAAMAASELLDYYWK